MFTAFWGEQQAVVTFVAAACIFSGLSGESGFLNLEHVKIGMPLC